MNFVWFRGKTYNTDSREECEAASAAIEAAGEESAEVWFGDPNGEQCYVGRYYARLPED